ncbi:MAG: PorT family protein [Bacteroidota bacterium]|nr:MAG: PorT family protein [Bacteroidota bacterium]
MKKLVLYTFISLFVATNAFSQFKLGLRGGFNIDNIKVDQNSSDRYQVSYESGLGFHFGLTSQLKISKLFIQPDLLFSTVTHDVTVEDIINNGVPEIGKQKFNKVDLPIIAGLKFDNNLKLGIGPVFTRVVSSKSDILDEEERKQATVGYQMVAGFDWKKFNLEARYEGNLSRYGAGVKFAGSTYEFDQRGNQFIVSMAYYF